MIPFCYDVSDVDFFKKIQRNINISYIHNVLAFYILYKIIRETFLSKESNYIIPLLLPA